MLIHRTKKHYVHDMELWLMNNIYLDFVIGGFSFLSLVVNAVLFI
jgi:hypothetical protein